MRETQAQYRDGVPAHPYQIVPKARLACVKMAIQAHFYCGLEFN
jgi:hypothetical protein